MVRIVPQFRIVDLLSSNLNSAANVTEVTKGLEKERNGSDKTDCGRAVVQDSRVWRQSMENYLLWAGDGACPGY